MGKRKEDQRRDDSSSSSSSLDAKRRKPRQYQTGKTSRPNDGTLTLIELKDAIQDKESTEAKFNRKIVKLKEKRKKDKEDLRILKGHVGILMENFRILKEGHEYLKSKIQEMRKEGCADHYKASPSQRSQLSQLTRFRLVIENSVSETIYKKETVETKDGGGHIRVIMYDGGNPIAPDHPLASGKVELVVIEGRFNDKRDSWSKEEFEKSIITPREGMIRLVKNGSFHLIGGRCDHQGAIIMDNSQKREVKLGVMIAVHREERVLEGVSNPFKVQEGKTKSSKKKGEKPSPVPTQNLVHPTQHGEGPLCPVYPDEQHGLPRPVIEDVLHKAVLLPPNFKECGNHTKFPTNGTAEDNRLSYPPATVPLMVEGNGQALNGNCQNLSREILAQISGQSISGYSMQHGQGYSWATPSTQNQQAAEYFPVNRPLLARGQDQYTSLPGSSEHAYHNPSNYALLNGIQSIFSPEDARYLNAQTQMQDICASDILDWSSRCGRVLLQWDNPHVELMLLYSTKSRFYGESFPSTSLMDKTHKLLGSISSVGSVWKKLTIEPYDSDDEPPVKKQRNVKYQLRFVNRVCNDYYTRELIKSEDGTFLKIALYNENNLVVTSGLLSSASVEVVLLHGDFNAEGQDYWTSEEFSTSLVHPQSAEEPPALGGDRVLALTDGEADLGNVNFQTSSFHARIGKFKMGVVIKNVREGNVQEGITSPFVVRVRLGEDHIHTTIFPPAFLDSSSCWNTNHNQLQQLASNNIATTTPAAGGGGGGGNNHPHPPSHDGSMATAAGGGGGEGGGGGGEGDDDGGPNKPMSMSERARLVPVPQPESGLNCPRCNSTNTNTNTNTNLTHPRHLCLACRRSWISGRELRKYTRHFKVTTGAKAARIARALSAKSTTPSVEELADSNVN